MSNQHQEAEGPGFFLTEQVGQETQQFEKQDEPQQMQGQEEVAVSNNENSEIDEDYGKMKMEIFKQQCRNLLNPAFDDTTTKHA